MEHGQGSVERLEVEEVEEAPRPRQTAQVVAMPTALPPLPQQWATLQAPPEPLPAISASPPVPTAAPRPPDPPPSPVLAALRVIARILAVRLILLLSVLAGFVLGVMAMLAQTWPSLAILGTYACLTVLPLVWLEVGQRPHAD